AESHAAAAGADAVSDSIMIPAARAAAALEELIQSLRRIPLREL
ncbi:MAG: hypothetical protein K0S65_6499, partial [Labilithrix sp.]|nr:hypothetical protein [Labilithrix sp.]